MVVWGRPLKGHLGVVPGHEHVKKYSIINDPFVMIIHIPLYNIDALTKCIHDYNSLHVEAPRYRHCVGLTLKHTDAYIRVY